MSPGLKERDRMSNAVKVWCHGAMAIPLTLGWFSMGGVRRRCVPGRSFRLAESRSFDSEVQETQFFGDSQTGALAPSVLLLKGRPPPSSIPCSAPIPHSFPTYILEYLYLSCLLSETSTRSILSQAQGRRYTGLSYSLSILRSNFILHFASK